MVKKIYKKLTKEQKERGVIFSSTLSNYRTEQEWDKKHEVFKDDSQMDRHIELLMNDFNGLYIYKYNIIRGW